MWSSATVTTPSSLRLHGTHADVVPKLQAAYPATFPSSIKQKDEFFGGWGGLNPYGYIGGNSGGGAGQTSMWNIAPYGNHEDLYTVQDNLSKVHGNHLFKAGVFLGWNEKVEDKATVRTGRSLPSGIYDGPGSLGSVTANAQTNNAWPTFCCRALAPPRRCSPASREQHRRSRRRSLARY